MLRIVKNVSNFNDRLDIFLWNPTINLRYMLAKNSYTKTQVIYAIIQDNEANEHILCYLASIFLAQRIRCKNQMKY